MATGHGKCVVASSLAVSAYSISNGLKHSGLAPLQAAQMRDN